jgi:hypothetical protein
VIGRRKREVVGGVLVTLSKLELYFIGHLFSSFQNFKCTIVDGGPGIMAKIFGVLGTKICYFIKENMSKNGPLVFRTVLCSKYDEKLGNCQRKTLRN